MKRDWIKVYRVALGSTIVVVNETNQGVDTPRVRLEGRVFGSTGSEVREFVTPDQADAFFDGFTQEVAEGWWRDLKARVEVDIDCYWLCGSSARQGQHAGACGHA